MPRVLLIVDDCAEIARALRRCLKHGFDAVHLAFDPLEAEEILANAEPAVTHLLCDHFLGETVTPGSELVQRWRRRHQSICRAALFSGSAIFDIEPLAGVDRVFRKPLDIGELERFFLSEATTA